MRVESGALRSGAARLERVRDAVNPSDLPLSFPPAGMDAVSVSVSNRLAAKASETVTQLWSTYATLDAAVTRLRGSAHGYDETESESVSALAGGAVGGGVGASIGATVRAPWAIPTPAVIVPAASTPAPAATPEQLSAALHGGAGAAPVREFAQQWKSFAAALRSATDEAMAVRGAVGQSWQGTAHDAADAEFSSVRGDLERQMGSAEKVGMWAGTHATSFEDAARPGAGVPEPPRFWQWHQNLENAVAADAQFPGVYTPAVIAAQEELGQGYARTGQAYGQYAVDPVTGELIDAATGLPIDPATGLPIADDLADEGTALGEGQDPEELLSSGAQLLSGLLDGVVGGLGGAVDSITQAGQVAAQVAAQTVGQLAKAMPEPSVPVLDGLGLGGGGLAGLGAGDFGAGAGGAGGTQPSGAVSGPGVSTAGAPPPPATSAAASAGPSGIRSAEPGMRGMGMGGMPMMPMGGMGGGAGTGPASPTNPDAAPDGKKLVQPNRPNTARVIGETSAERVESKRQRREQRMQEARESAKEDQP